MAAPIEPGADFAAAATLFKALSHPLRLRLVCGLCREPASLSRIAGEIAAPLSTVAMHLGVLRRSGILSEDRRGAAILFQVQDERVRRIVCALCGAGATHAPEDWAWSRLAATELAPTRAARRGSGGR